MEPRNMWITLCSMALLAVTVAAIQYPTYSLDAMPSTRFTCRDKILGGYYADAETQCQMFHVCVKVAGVGVQDFRFLCPNGTAFDQEAQTCADWGDVDCEAATLYYGSDNFDLYRVGSGFESKRAPFPDEEEATFHLQRAETSDARRSKQVVINQNAKTQQQYQQPYRQQPANYRTTNGHFMNYNNIPSGDKTTSYYQDNSFPSSTPSRPATPSAPQPTTTTTTTTTTPPPPPTTTTTTTTTIRPSPFVAQQQQTNQNFQQNYNPYSQFTNGQSMRLSPYSSPSTTQQPIQQTRQTFFQPSTSAPVNHFSVSDDIFRGSYSSNFFNNRNNGKEDFEAEFAEKKSVTTTKATQKPTANRGRTSNRGRVTYNSSQRGTAGRDNFNVISNAQRPAAYQSSPVTTVQTTTPVPVTRVQNNVNANGRNYNNIRTNAQRSSTTNVTPAPVTYRPSTISSSSFRVPVAQQNNFPSSTASPLNPEDQFYDIPRKVPGKSVNGFSQSTTTTTVAPQQQFKFNPNANYDLTAVQQSKFTYNPFGEPRVSPSLETATSSSFFPSTSESTTTTPLPSSPKVPFFPTPAPQLQQSSPRGFEVIPITLQPQPKVQTYQSPQPFARRTDSKNYTPSSIKKFSTLVPRELYDPTTFKPATYKKPVDNLAALKSVDQNKQRDLNTKLSNVNFVTQKTTVNPASQFSQSTQSPQIASFNAQPQFQNNQKTFNTPSTPFQPQQPVQNSFPTTINQQFYSTPSPVPAVNYNTFSRSTTIAPRRLEEIDENDGQYHPELYEKDFARYKLKNKKVNKVSVTAAPSTFSTAAFQSTAAVAPKRQFQSPGSGEDEFLKTAHSQNIVASGNQLLYDQLKNQFKQSQQSTVASPRPFSKTAPTIPPNATTTKRPVKPKAEKDVSYDYQYYDLGADSSPKDYEFDVLEDFGKINKKTKSKKQ